MTGQGRLPVVFPPEIDERLSSWLARLASFYAMTVPDFLSELGLPGRDVIDLEWRPSEGEGALIAGRTGLSDAARQAMTFCEVVPEARMMIARKTRHHCPLCPADIHRRSFALPWRFRCPVHGEVLRDTTGAALPDILGPDRFLELEPCAEVGADRLDAWARGGDLEGPDPPGMLALLTTRHRRASPPSLAEQPRMSLQTRRDYHAFLSTPIIRQALPVIVPEYDQAAPVLAKPVRPGLHGLAQGSLLQAFALTVGLGRILGNPVGQVISVLLASDDDGQGRVRDALGSWPLSHRRRISARFWRAQRAETDRQIAEKARKGRQSQEYRRVQSHDRRYRIL